MTTFMSFNQIGCNIRPLKYIKCLVKSTMLWAYLGYGQWFIFLPPFLLFRLPVCLPPFLFHSLSDPEYIIFLINKID